MLISIGDEIKSINTHVLIKVQVKVDLQCHLLDIIQQSGLNYGTTVPQGPNPTRM